MKKTIILLIFFLAPLIVIAIPKDSIQIVANASDYDTVNIEANHSSQYKNIRIHNLSGGTLNIALQTSEGKRDTIGEVTIADNTIQDFPNETSHKIYIKGTTAGTVKITIWYQPQTIPYPYSYSSTGELIIKNPYSFARYDYGFRDTVGTDPDTLTRRIDTSGGISRTSLTQFSCTQYWGCWIASDDTIIVSTDIAFPANKLHYIYSSESETRFLFDVNYVSQLYWKSTVTGTATVRMGLWFY